MSSMFKSSVWGRSGQDTMTRNAFYFILGVMLSWGFVLTILISKMTATWQPGILALLGVGLVIPIVGIFMSAKSDNSFISFVGFNLVVVGISAVIGPVLAMYTLQAPGLVERAVTFTGLTTIVMGVSGFLYPNFYRSIGGFLFGALLTLVAVSIVRLFIPAIEDVGIIDYIAAGIFSLYIGYDMYRASDIPATLDNVIDVAVSFYLDIINLFLTLLRILGDSDD